MIIATEYCERVFDGTHATPIPTKNGFKLLTSKNILNGYIDKENAYYISRKDYEEINRRSQVKQWDILFSMIGTVGNVCLVRDKNIDFAIKNMGVFSCGNESRAKWLYYYLQSPHVKKTISNYLTGAIQKFVTLDWLRNFEIPEYDEKKYNIVKFLEFIDAKIANNNAVCAELEAMAKQLYDYWFVQFDFPDKNGKPYKSSGGKMVYNETLKREIPEGWEVGKVGDICNNVNNPVPAGETLKGMLYTPIEVFPSNKMFFYGGLPYTEAKSSLIKYDKKNIILGAMRVYFHKLIISAEQGITRTTAIVMKPKIENTLGFTYFHLNQDLIFSQAEKISVGTQQPYVKWNNCYENIEILLPNVAIQKNFSNKIDSLISLGIKLIKEKEQLTSLRDFLLPMLMNGQVEVGA